MSDDASVGVTLAEVIADLRLDRIRLKTLVVRAPDVASFDAEDEAVGIESQANLVSRDETAAAFEVGVRLWMPNDAEPADAPLVIQALRVLEYGNVPRALDDDLLRELARAHVPREAWPYLRADVHRACLEADLPPLLLPVWRGAELRARGEVEPTAIGAAWPAWRDPLLEVLDEISPFLDSFNGHGISRMGPPDDTDESWGLLADALESQHRHLRRHVGSAPAGSAAEIFDEAAELLKRLGRVLARGRRHRPEDCGEALLRWNEIARDAERLFKAAAKANIIDREGVPKLRRFTSN